MNSLRDVFALLNEMQTRGVLHDYAIGGATAALFYAEPTRTYDLDVFVLLPGERDASLLSLAPLYTWLWERGYRPDAEHVLIHGVPVQFLPVFNDLVMESLREARTFDYEGTPVRVIGPEHLCALAIQAGGRRRRERAWQILESGAADRSRVSDILRRHNLPALEEP